MAYAWRALLWPPNLNCGCKTPHLFTQVYDRDYLKPDDVLGQLEFPVKTILTWTQVRAHAQGLRRVNRGRGHPWCTQETPSTIEPHSVQSGSGLD